MSAPDQERDGGPFTAGAMCPHCCHCDVHPMRVPNPAPPRCIRRGEDMEVARFGGPIRITPQPDLYDRWDERTFGVVRTCTSCGWEWGQR